MEQFYEISGIISVILLVIALTIAIKKYKLFAENEKWYIYYIIFVSVIEFLSYSITFFEIFGGKSLLYPIYISGELFVISGIFIKKLNLSKYYFYVVGALSLYILVVDKILPQYENDFSKAFSNILIIIIVAYSLIQEIKKGKGKDYFLIVDKMLFLYFTVSIFIFLFQHQLLKISGDDFPYIWAINNLMVCILYGLIIKTFLKLKK